MEFEDLTHEDILSAVMRAITDLEGTNLYTPGPYTITLKPLGALAIYIGADGQTYQRPYTLAIDGERVVATVGERVAVESRTLWVPLEDASAEAAFTFSGTLAERKTWKGRIFRAGSYPDKCGDVTPAHLREIVRNFPAGGVRVMSEHEESLIGMAMADDGARLVRVWTESGDSELHGEMAVPGWLAFGLRNIKKSVSVGLTAMKNGLREISLVLNPRVADAAVFAFAQTPAFNQFAEAHPALEATLRRYKDAPMHNKTSLKDRVKALFSRVPADQRGDLTEAELDAHFSETPAVAGTTPPPPPPVDSGLAQRVQQLESQIAEREAQFATQQRRHDALSFYEGLLQGGRAVPAQRDQIVAEFEAASIADASLNFSATDERSYVLQLKKRYEAVQPRFAVGGQRIDSGAGVPQPSGLGVFSEEDFARAGMAKQEVKK
jgi:hypothetical protein